MAFRILLFFLSIFIFHQAGATRISGTIRDSKGEILSFSSILVKGTTLGTTANKDGKYFLDLDPGNYIIVCQHVGYTRVEKSITIAATDTELDFVLTEQQLSMQEVIIKSNAEDPAYEIIRQAIRKRPYYKGLVDSFQCEVYIKGQLRLRDYPKTFLGQKITFDDGDTSKQKMIFLSETVATYSFTKPDNEKVEVLSTRVSGQSDGFGLASPRFYSFYDNNVQISPGLNPRGFISPIADGALGFYNYKYLGSFFEDGLQVNRIRVIPKRQYEPLFSGDINIIENDWRIHSVDLLLTAKSQMELVDTLNLQQLYVPVEKDIWMVKSQVLYPVANFFGFHVAGNIVTMYSNYDLHPDFGKKYFNNIIMKYDSSSNKRSKAYWDTVRPVPLLPVEVEDFRRKDSLEIWRKNPRILDSLDRRANKLTVSGLLVYGQTFNRQSRDNSWSYKSVLQTFSFNTVEGWVMNLNGAFMHNTDKRKGWYISPTIRYGFTNHHLNASLLTRFSYGKQTRNSFGLSGGKRVFQINNANPIPPLMNTIATLLRGYNYMKIYEAWFARATYNKTISDGLFMNAYMAYQDRIPLENTDSTIWTKSSKRSRRTPNYPVELVDSNFKRHQAVIVGFSISWRPGTRYIEFPDRKVNVGSKYPLFTVGYAKGIQHWFGSDVNYDKWSFAISDEINFKIPGQLNYRVSLGGFLNNKAVELPDYQHFNGNRVVFATPYLNSFQLAPYYQNSTTEGFYAIIHVEHHFNGFLTNKIPYVKKFNLRLVAGMNSFTVRTNDRYWEFFAGFENIFKIIRVDFVEAFQNGPYTTGFRIGIRGFTGFGDDF